MEYGFRNTKVQQLCTNYEAARKQLGGEKIARALVLLMTDIKNFEHIIDFKNVAKLKKYKIHELIGKEKGVTSLCIDYSYRMTLIVKAVNDGNKDDEILILEVSKHYDE